MHDIRVLTYYEYEARMYAHELKQVDKQHEIHIQAWVNKQVNATKKKGDGEISIYKEFKDFFNFEKEIRKIKSNNNDQQMSDKRMKSLARLAKNVNRGEV